MRVHAPAVVAGHGCEESPESSAENDDRSLAAAASERRVRAEAAEKSARAAEREPGAEIKCDRRRFARSQLLFDREVSRQNEPIIGEQMAAMNFDFPCRSRALRYTFWSGTRRSPHQRAHQRECCLGRACDVDVGAVRGGRSCLADAALRRLIVSASSIDACDRSHVARSHSVWIAHVHRARSRRERDLRERERR